MRKTTDSMKIAPPLQAIARQLLKTAEQTFPIAPFQESQQAPSYEPPYAAPPKCWPPQVPQPPSRPRNRPGPHHGPTNLHQFCKLGPEPVDPAPRHGLYYESASRKVRSGGPPLRRRTRRNPAERPAHAGVPASPGRPGFRPGTLLELGVPVLLRPVGTRSTGPFRAGPGVGTTARPHGSAAATAGSGAGSSRRDQPWERLPASLSGFRD